ncbi:MAG: hypothetical protein P4L53_04900 [Candidatus Obscuribacterales bacterium]|nr:hypothetical protein [Candidatus Obscuribacterales bacterium]
MIAALFQETNLRSEPWGLTVNRLKQLVIQLLANPATVNERAVQVFVREALLQIDCESRLLHKAIVIDVNLALERIVAAGIPIVSVDVAAGGAMWFERYGLNVTQSQATTQAGLPLFFVLWKQKYIAPSTERAPQK